LALTVIHTAMKSPKFSSLELPVQLEFIRKESLAYLAMTNQAKAEAVLLTAKKAHPKEDAPLSGLLLVYLQARDFNKALAVVKEQLVLNPNNIVAMQNEGAIYLETKQPDKAQAVLEKALQISPENVPLLMNYALTKLQLNDLTGAEANYRKLLALQTNNPVPYFFLGEIAFRQSKKDEAIRHYEKFLSKIAPDSKDAQQVQQRLKELKGS
jgi:tetratricopeptide (TPR) repeat protein